MILVIVAVVLILGGASICALGPFAFDKEPVPSILMMIIGLLVMLAGIILVAPIPI